MFLVLGSNTYGKIDRIPGMGYVATEFFHAYYFPILPYRTRFIVSRDAGGFEGGTLPLSLKSIVTAWLRAGSLVFLFVLALLALAAFLDQRVDLAGRLYWALGTAITGLIVLWLHKGLFREASYARAQALADQLRMDPRLRIYIDLKYEQINDLEAERRLDSLGFAANELDNLDDELARSGLRERHEFR